MRRQGPIEADFSCLVNVVLAHDMPPCDTLAEDSACAGLSTLPEDMSACEAVPLGSSLGAAQPHQLFRSKLPEVASSAPADYLLARPGSKTPAIGALLAATNAWRRSEGEAEAREGSPAADGAVPDTSM